MSLTASGLDQLAGARVMLAETKGFLYLPVFVPHQVAGEDVLQDLRAANEASGYDWREIAWPELCASTESSASTPPSTAEIADARKALLSTLDENMEDSDSQPRTLVLDASPSSRHLLAQDVVVYLNQRRQSLRERAHRLIVIWPLALRDDLIGGAPDLWSVRALAPYLSFSDSTLLDRGDERASVPPRAQEPIEIQFDTAAQERKFALWKATGDLRAADLSMPELLGLLNVLWMHHQGREMMSLIDLGLGIIHHDEGVAALANFAALAQSALGEPGLALASARKAVTIYGRLVTANPAAYEPELAMSVNNLASFLSANGDREGALEAARNAVAIYRRLAVADAAASESDLAMSVNNLANTLSAIGDANGALVAAREAVAIRRRLARANPTLYEEDFAMSVGNLANRLSETGDYDSALVAAHESVETYRRLAVRNPVAFAPGLAASVNNLSIVLSARGELSAAIASAAEALAMYRSLMEQTPATYQPDLAMSLTGLAHRLSATGDHQRAVPVAREAVTIYRRLAQDKPTVYEPDLARSLCVFAMALRTDGQTADARAAVVEAVTLLDRLAAQWPEAFGKLQGAAQVLLSEIDAP